MTDLKLRPPTEADIPRLLEISQELSAELGIPDGTQEADYVLQWSMPGVDRERNFAVAEVDGLVVATAGFRVHKGQAQCSGSVVPTYRKRGIGRALLQWNLDQIALDPSATEVFTGASSIRQDATALITSFGFEHARSFFRMSHTDPANAPQPVWPEGIRVDTSLRGGALRDAIIETHDNSFIDHWNFHPFEPADFDHYMKHPDIDYELLFLAFDGDRPVAMNLCFLEKRDAYCHGTVGTLGTVRGYRGRGLATAMLNHGVRELAARGATLVELGVDSENPTGALGLYERNGFTRSHEWRTYRLGLTYGETGAPSSVRIGIVSDEG